MRFVIGVSLECFVFFGIENKFCSLFSESVLTCCNWNEDKLYAGWFLIVFYLFALSDSNLMGDGRKPGKNCRTFFVKTSHWCVWLILAPPPRFLRVFFFFLPGELQRKQVLHWNDKFCCRSETRWFSQLKPLRVVNITVLRLHGRRTKSSEANTERWEGGSGRGLPRHIDLCSAASKGIDGFRLPPWLTFTLGMSCFYLSNQCVILMPIHNLHWCLTLCGNFYRLGACVFLLRGFPLSDRLNSAQFFFLLKKKKSYFGSSAVSQASEAASH